jgi:tetratricopeptide (TPR) repeat protein
MKRLLLAAVLCACAQRRIPSVPAADWQEYQTEHFILDTDAGPEDARAMMGTFESLRAADLLLLAGAHADYAGHIRLFVPAEAAVFVKLAPADYVAAYYTHGVANSGPVIVAPAYYCLHLPQLVAHELAHAISYYIYPQQKKWYAEGLAQFVETLGRSPVRIDVPGRVSDVSGAAGEILPKMNGFIHGKVGIMPAARLLNAAAADRDAKPETFYDSSWLLYHWLWNTQGRELGAFQKRLADGEDWDDAWGAAFPDLTASNEQQMDSLFEDLKTYRRNGRFKTAMIEVQSEFAIVQRPFPAWRLWVALLRKDWPKDEADRREQQLAELEKARADDPKNPAVLLWLSSLKKTATVESARAIAQDAPGDFAGWLGLATATADPAEKEKALRQAVATGPDCATCNNNLAWLLARDGRAKEALAYSNRAVDLAPWNPSFLDTLAEVAVALSQCGKAEKLQRRALRMALFVDRPPAEYEARLASIRKRCATAPTPNPAHRP